jgi:hypothetical protein
VDPVIWCPPTFVGNSGIECFNGVRGFALLFLLVGLFPNSVGALPPDAAMPSVARMELSAIRDRLFDCDKAPDFASLHPGYDCVEILCLLMTAEYPA